MAFADFLNLDAKIYRSIGHSVNQYGEVVPDDDTQQASTKVRIDPLKGAGLTTVFQGQTVDIHNRIFLVSNLQISEGDIIKIDNSLEQYEILLLEKLYNKSTLHHFEALCRRTDIL